MRWLRLIIGLPILAILISFALTNRAPVQLGLWPTDVTMELPLSPAVLGAAAVMFVIGGLAVWMTELPHRGRLRRVEHTNRLLEDELKALRARPAGTDVPPPSHR